MSRKKIDRIDRSLPEPPLLMDQPGHVIKRVLERMWKEGPCRNPHRGVTWLGRLVYNPEDDHGRK